MGEAFECPMLASPRDMGVIRQFDRTLPNFRLARNSGLGDCLIHKPVSFFGGAVALSTASTVIGSLGSSLSEARSFAQ